MKDSSIASPLQSAGPRPTLLSASRAALSVLLALSFSLLAGCESPDTAVEPQAAKPTPVRVPLSPEQESALNLLAALATDAVPQSALPEGIKVDKIWQDKVMPQSAKFKAVGKISFDVKANRSDNVEQDTRMLYTVYPTVADATARFAAMDEPPADRTGVKSRSPLSVAVPDVPTWGEISNEAYAAKKDDGTAQEEKPLVRVSTAARIGRVIAVTQTMTMTKEPDARALSNAIELLKVAVERARAVKDTGPGSALTEAASAATDSPAVPAMSPAMSPAASPAAKTH